MSGVCANVRPEKMRSLLWGREGGNLETRGGTEMLRCYVKLKSAALPMLEGVRNLMTFGEAVWQAIMVGAQ